ncbi:MAG: dockerin type I repeat-containing protein [Acutalibacteraceae bacterium]
MLKKAIGLFSAVVMMVSVITATPVSAENQTPAGYVVMSVERFTIGEGYYLQPQKVPFYEGDSYASVVVRQLGEENLKFTGTVDDGFYLLGIKNADNGEIDPPEYLVDYRIENSVDFSENADSDLDSGDYTYMSGWMFYVNNTELFTAMPDTVPQDGDVFRLMFTLTWGQDLGNSSWNNIAELPDKDAVTRMISRVISREDYKELAEIELRDTYLNEKFSDELSGNTSIGAWIDYLPKMMSQAPANGLSTEENFERVIRAFTDVLPGIGDINGDSVFNIKDLVHIKIILSDTQKTAPESADIDFDGACASGDLVRIRQMLLTK